MKQDGTDDRARVGQRMDSEIVQKQGQAERLPDEGPDLEIGAWYWIKDKDDEEKPAEFLACITSIGSNFAGLQSPQGSTWRVHFNEFDKTCRHEPDPEAEIRKNQAHYQGVVKQKLKQVQEILARLGLDSRDKLEGKIPGAETSRELALLSGTDHVKKYKQDLIQAKEKDLPGLFGEIRDASKSMATWMKAAALPLEGAIGNLEDSKETIEDRIFSISLYAGLTEEVAEVKKGEPAPAPEKLRILQRLHFMDEECLVNYRHGGMTFDDIKQFDRWLARSENFSRILPFPRCMAAFQVRRHRKNRGPAYSLETAFIHFRLEQEDKLTFLYIRNGERLYRMNCDLEFGPLIFPGKDEFSLAEPLMAKRFCSSIKEVITKRHFDSMTQEHREGKRQYDAWKKANRKAREHENPFREFWWPFSFSEWEPFNPSSVYYDEIKDAIECRVKQYNRIALIVQGLLDRSEVLHPHPPYKLWSPGGFEAAVDLIYLDHGLHYGEPPDFEAYRKTLNVTLQRGCWTIGQQAHWEGKMKEAWRRRHGRENTYSGHIPWGNPGPGTLAQVQSWSKRSRKATYQWLRKRQNYGTGYCGGRDPRPGDPVPCAYQVPEDRLLNVSQYKPGDYQRFYQDPRTREKYLQWAGLLLLAEEYHAGNIDLETGRLKKDEAESCQA